MLLTSDTIKLLNELDPNLELYKEYLKYRALVDVFNMYTSRITEFLDEGKWWIKKENVIADACGFYFGSDSNIEEDSQIEELFDNAVS